MGSKPAHTLSGDSVTNTHQITILLRNFVAVLGEFLIIPRGVEHKPVAEAEVHVLLFEPQGTLNTGNVRDVKTVDVLETI